MKEGGKRRKVQDMKHERRKEVLVNHQIMANIFNNVENKRISNEDKTKWVMSLNESCRKHNSSLLQHIYSVKPDRKFPNSGFISSLPFRKVGQGFSKMDLKGPYYAEFPLPML